MKKIFVFFAAIIVNTYCVCASQLRHFAMNVNDIVSEEQVVSLFSVWFDLPSNTNFVQSKVTTDSNGGKHFCYDQYVNGVKVEGGQILVHSYAGKINDLNGVVLEKDVELSPSLIKNKVMKRSKRDDVGDIVIIPINNNTEIRYAYKILSEDLEAYVYIDTENSDTLKIVPFVHETQTSFTTNTLYYGRRSLTVNESGQWRYYSVQNPRIETIDATGQSLVNASASTYNTLIQLCNTYYEKEADSLNSYIASIDYEILNNSWWEGIEEGTNPETYYPDLYIKITDNSGSVVYQSGVMDNWKYLHATFNPMILLDGRQYTIQLYDEDVISDDEAGGFTISSTNKGTGTLTTSNYKVTINVTGHPIRDAHWGMEKTLAYFKNVLNRNSYDGNGAVVYQFINPFRPGHLPNNASARTEVPYCMLYGMGDGITLSPVVALDVMAHEFSHIVTVHNISNGLEYKGESGALNEGFSDIFGVLVEGYTLGQYDWTIGEKITLTGPYLRSLKAPKSGSPAQPTTYGKGTWKDPSQTECDTCDNGGVHTNSSILNYWFYLLCNGGSGTNDNQQSYSVNGIGINKATSIVYNTWMNRLTYTSTFADARASFIKEVIAQYGKGSKEHQSVVNAWYAVGVGDKYVEPTEDFQLKPGKYVIVAGRNKTGDKNWYYMTSDLGTASTKRFQAVSTGTENMDAIALTDLEDKYVWTLEADGTNWKLKNGTQYVTWTSGNSANLGATAKSLTFEVADNQVQAHFNDGTNERYLSLNATTNNNYFAFYANTNQITNLFFLPYDDGSTPPPPARDCKSVPYTETFASSQGDFSVDNLTLPDGFTSIWNWDSQYGMVAKCIKGSTKYESESWLISPCVELPENETCVLSFSHAAKFFQSTSQMSLWISTDYDESDPEAAQWNRLIIPTYPTGSNWNWYESGDIDLSEYKGQYVNIAFRYTSTSSYAPQWEIKNFAIRKQSTTGIDGIYSNKPSAIKILRDGQIFILRGDKTYTVTGQEVK